MGDQGRVGVLMGAGCAFVCLFLFVSLALTEVAMQDRRLVSCADALASVGGGNASTGAFSWKGTRSKLTRPGCVLGSRRAWRRYRIPRARWAMA